MAGFGFDAAIMADAPEKLKAKVGPAAYMVSGTRNLRGPQFKVRVRVDDNEEFSRRTRFWSLYRTACTNLSCTASPPPPVEPLDRLP